MEIDLEIRCIAVCKADFPDDFTDEMLDEKGEVIKPGGLNFTEAIIKLLEKEGMEISLPNADLEHYSWEINVCWRGRDIQIFITDLMEEKIIHINLSFPFLAKIFSKKAFYLDISFLNTVHSLLSEDSRFSNLKWYKVYDAAHKGYSTPVGM